MKSKTYMPLLTLIIQLLLFATSCKQTTEPKLEAELKLELEDASCTEAWIKLTTTNLQLPATINLLQDGNLSETINLLGADTVLYVDSLLPNQTYKFQASIQLYLPKAGIQPFNHSGLPAEGRHSSNELTVTTMDTTSHNFTWQSWEFGQHSSSTLYDVAIIDENNIWAVGEIYMLDSLGNPDPNAYNAVHWDGTKWELKRINVNFRGNIITPPLEGVFAFSGNDIWFVGSLPIHGDGNNWIIYDLRTTLDPNISVSRCWGSSSNDMYFVGRNGNIAHWDGVKWTKIESGTGLVIGDIWGIENKDGRYNKYLAAGDVMIILNGENKVNIVYPEPNMFINSIWGITNNLIYTAGNGIILFKNNEWEEIDIPELNTVYSIKGNNFNNVFGISSVFSVVHFNGFSWQFINRGDTKIYFRLGVKNDLAIAVGWQGDRAALTLLRRIN